MKSNLKTVLFTLIFSLTGMKGIAAQENTAFWTKIIQSLSQGIGSVNVENAALGIDNGLIKNLVVGVGRSVERNPHSTSTKDKFLVKDRLRLGLELGAGFIVAGSASYVQEWTLVYPVATEFQGHLSRKFIIDLFLPYTVKNVEESQLPNEYVVTREAYLEGKGRIKFGDIPGLPLGTQASVSKIKLASTVAKRFANQTYKIMQETSHFKKYYYELWLTLGVLNIPLFDASQIKGSSYRTFYEMDYKKWNPIKKRRLFQSVFKGYLNPLTQIVEAGQKEDIENQQNLQEYLSDYQVDKSWTSEFKERTTSFTLFGLYNKDTINREDEILIRDADDISRWWQWEDRQSFDWTSGVRSEAYRTKVLFSAQRDALSQEFLNPLLSLNIVIDDSNSTQEELKNNYIELATDFIQSDTTDHTKAQDQYINQLKTEQCPSCFDDMQSTLSIRRIYNQEQMEALILTDQESWQSYISEVTGKSWSYWQRALEEKLHSLQRRRMKQTRIPLKDMAMARKISHFLKYMKAAKDNFENTDKTLSYRNLCSAMRSSFSTNSVDGHNIILLKAVNKAIEYKLNLSNKTLIEHRLYYQNHLFSESIYSSHDHLREEMLQEHFAYILEDPAEIYYFF